MTNQEIFDIVLAHLRKQGRPSLITDSYGGKFCAYRGDGGEKCALGCLIKDEYYSPLLEGRRLDSPRVREALLNSAELLPPGWIDLLSELQDAHDIALFDSLSHWEDAMSLIAEENNLTYTEPQQ